MMLAHKNVTSQRKNNMDRSFKKKVRVKVRINGGAYVLDVAPHSWYAAQRYFLINF